MTTTLKINYADKEYAKEAGARWNPTIKKWTTNKTEAEFYQEMNDIKENGIPNGFYITLHERWWDYAQDVGAKNGMGLGVSGRFYNFDEYWVEGMSKNEFWNKMKELKEIHDKKDKTKWKKLLDKENEYCNKKEIMEYEQQQQIDNEQNQMFESDMICLIDEMSTKMNLILQ